MPEDHANVVLMCGPAGAGKTTFARQLETRGYTRLSIDEEVVRRIENGILTPNSDVRLVSISIEEDLRARLIDLVRRGEDVVVDFSFPERSSRDAYRRIVTENGGTADLVYIRVPPDDVHASRRWSGHQGQEHESITLDDYIDAFEEPEPDEQAIVIDSLARRGHGAG